MMKETGKTPVRGIIRCFDVAGLDGQYGRDGLFESGWLGHSVY